MKKLALFPLLFLFISVKAQIGSPSLSVGTDEVLFEKGILDVELIGEIVAEKQNEIKQEFAKRVILNKKLSEGPYLTYDYAKYILEALLDHNDKNYIKKALLERSAELAVVVAILEGYINIKGNSQIDPLVEAYQLLSQVKYEEVNTLDKQSITILESLTPTSTSSSAISSNGFLPKISKVYRLKTKGKYISSNLTTHLHFILLDMFLEICRKNESLQQLGFFQKSFDEDAFLARSHYRRFISNHKGSNIVTLLSDLYKEADKIIDLNLKYSNIILNQPSSINTIANPESRLTTLANNLFNDVNALSAISDLTIEESEILEKLGSIAYYGRSAMKLTEDSRRYDDWLFSLKEILPKLVRLNVKMSSMKPVINDIDILADAISNYQINNVITELSLLGTNPELIKKNLAIVFEVVSNLRKATSYDQVAKIIVDIGDVFTEIPKSRLMDDLANLQAYLIVNQEENRIDVKVEDLILFLGEKYINNSNGSVSLYFTVGYNYASFESEGDSQELSFASEKIGLKFKIFDIYKFRRYENRYYIQKQKPIVNDIYLLLYGSGLLYQIDALKSEDLIEGASYGTMLGIHFFNGLDLGVGIQNIQINDSREWMFNVGLDIPLAEYLARLGKK